MSQDPWGEPPEQPADMSADFTISTIPFGTSTETKDSQFRQIIEDIRSPKWKENVAAIHEAYTRGAGSAVPKEIRGEMETLEEAQVRAGKEAAAALKLQLPGFLFSGTFSERNAKALLKHSGLICADLDGLGNTAASIKEQISSDPHVLGVFVSPTGTGLKVIFRCDPEKPHKETFAALEHYVAETFGLAIDQACSDVSRICYASHDPEAFIAEQAAVLPYPPPAPEKTFTPKAHAPGSEISPGDDFNQRGIESMPALLESHGWTHSHGCYWRRPGKSTGLSASLGYVAPGILRVFSSSPETGLPGDKKGYEPFAVYTHLVHNGNWHNATRALGESGYGSQTRKPSKSRQEFTLEKVAGPTPDPIPTGSGRAPSSFSLQAPNDPAILIGNRWISRGDIFILASTSGMGKSSFSIQASYHWALGLSLFGGFKPNGALKILIVQAEDGDGDIAEVRLSLEHAMKLTDEQKAQVDKNIVIVTDRVNRGARFRASLKNLVDAHKPDIVIINPLLAFMDGDVNASQDVGKFIREELNSLNEPASFAYGIVHHTSKPPKERNERRWNEVMYEMAGSADLTNAARAILSLQPGENKGEFKLRAAKRGMRAGLTALLPGTVNPELKFEAPVDEISIRHSNDRMQIHGQDLPVIHWERFEGAAVAPKMKAGRKPKYSIDEFFAKIPVSEKDAKIANQIHRDLTSGISVSGFRDLIRRAAEDGLVRTKFDPVKGDVFWMM